MYRIVLMTLVLLLVGALVPTPTAHAQHRNNLLTCTPTDGPYAAQSLFMRYDGLDDTLYLMSNSQLDPLAVIETGLDTPQFDVHAWSEDCRYLVASLGAWGEQFTALWDVLAPRRVDTFQTLGMFYPYYGIQPLPVEHGWILVQSLAGAYVWHLPTNTRWQIVSGSTDSGTNFGTTYYSARPLFTWDFDHNRVAFVAFNDNQAVRVIDLNTGQLMGRYPEDAERESVTYNLIGNGEYVRVRGKYSWTIYHITSHAAYTLLNRPFYDDGTYAFSDDGRFLLMEDYVGVRVWDVSQPTSGPQTPLLDLPLRWAEDARFLDNHTVEVLQYTIPHHDWDGFHYWRYDLPSGALLLEWQEESGNVCRYPSLREPSIDDLTWRWMCQERGYR